MHNSNLLIVNNDGLSSEWTSHMMRINQLFDLTHHGRKKKPIFPLGSVFLFPSIQMIPIVVGLWSTNSYERENQKVAQRGNYTDRSRLQALSLSS